MFGFSLKRDFWDVFLFPIAWYLTEGKAEQKKPRNQQLYTGEQ